MAPASLYPPSPADVPEGLTEPSSSYKTQITLVLFSLGLFFLLYFGIMAACLLFLAWSVISIFFVAVDRGFACIVLFQFVMCVPTLLLFIYMAKNLFRWGQRDRTDRVEVFEDEHPRLFDFIYRVCDETGAPYPKRIFVNYEVNAAAFSDGDSFYHLFIPTEKNLLLGLGLLNVINLTEFKALLAHEFGHFSQKSVRLGGYVYVALGIVNQIVEGRDFFDNVIEGWSRLDPRIAWPAWIFWGILWILRRVLMGLRYVMFFFNQSLSRQMEFNADLVAVSVAGSDAPVHLLCRAGVADHCMNQTVRDLQMALDHHLYTSDIFFHQAHAAGYLRRRDKKPQLGEPPTLPDDTGRTSHVFEPDDDERAHMWASHPSNFDREENAKHYYIRSTFDERSPWLLFDNVEQLRADVSYKFYRVHFKARKDVVQIDAEEIQAFIEEERAETTYDPRYQGLYDQRLLQLQDLHDLAQAARANPWPIAQLSQLHANLYTAEVKHRAQLHNRRMEEYDMLRAVSKGWVRVKNNEFEFRGEFYESRDASRLLRKVEREIEDDNDWLKDLDRRVFQVHFQMALQLSQEIAEDLFKRYRFHIDLQLAWLELRRQDQPVGAAIRFLSNLKSSRLDDRAFQEALAIFRDAHHALRDVLRDAEEMTFPALKNVPVGQPLRPFLLKKRLVDGLSKYEHSLSPAWINKLIDQFKEVQKKVNRVHFKSLGGILALQERIAQECLKRWQSLPAVVPLPPPGP